MAGDKADTGVHTATYAIGYKLATENHWEQGHNDSQRHQTSNILPAPIKAGRLKLKHYFFYCCLPAQTARAADHQPSPSRIPACSILTTLPV